MNVFTVATTFMVIFPAELPDKSMIASVVMGTRYRAAHVWLGIASAFLVHVLLAVAVGGVVTLLPERVVIGLVAALFTVGAGLLLFGGSQETTDEQLAEEEAAIAKMHASSPTKIAAMAFGVIFVSEWGDLTQIATVTLTSRYHDPVSVAIGAIAALWLVTGLAVLLGRRLVKSVPVHVVRRIAGAVLAALALWSLADFLATF